MEAHSVLGFLFAATTGHERIPISKSIKKWGHLECTRNNSAFNRGCNKTGQKGRKWGPGNQAVKYTEGKKEVKKKSDVVSVPGFVVVSLSASVIVPFCLHRVLSEFVVDIVSVRLKKS